MPAAIGMLELESNLGLTEGEPGNLGDFKSAGQWVFELRINYGPGYRVYFGQVGLPIVVILIAGDKSTQ